ncbi:MAG: flagellin lysine-N-methylase [Lachnospiraceae bacterium]|nr:flagellin lysine-N-methylase [Lachnospiraceae bacterium]
MQTIILELYDTFSCMAGDCPATCCAGWKIVVDNKDYERFQQMEPAPIRDDILSHIEERNGEYCFQNDSIGRCAMLDSDGLCRIQKNISEKALCNTCRKFPRLTAQVDGKLWISMMASCPVVAKYLLTKKVQWRYTDVSDGQQLLSGLPMWKDSENVLADFRKTINNNSFTFEKFVDVAMDCLDVLLRFPECPYLEDSFDCYQEEGNQTEMLSAFLQGTRTEWQLFFTNYCCYRIPGRYIEYPIEKPQTRVKQVLGELLIMRVILCSRYKVRNGLKETDWLEVLHWVYRFCVHGQKMGQQIHEMFLRWDIEMLQLAYPENKT